MDKNKFFEEIKGPLFNGRLSPSQRTGMEVKLAAFDERGICDDRWRAYMLATSYHETARAMLPVLSVISRLVLMALLSLLSRLVMMTVLLALLLAGWGCKPARVVTERVVTGVDSTAVHVLSDSVYRQERAVASLQASLKRAREENTRVASETRQHVIRYDTTAPPDTLTGKRPISSEVITTISTRYEKTVEDDAELQSAGAVSRGSLALEHRSQASAVEKHAREDRILKEKTASTRFNLKQFLAGVAVGIAIGIIAGIWLNRIISRFTR